MRVLDIDMDFFLNNIATGKSFDGMRLSDADYIPWTERHIRNFLEFNCGLDKDNKIEGCIVDEHVDVFYYIRDLIKANRMLAPFEVIHIDAHADLGLGDGAWSYIFEVFLSLCIEDRMNIDQYNHKLEWYHQLGSGNFLLYMIACEWVSKLTYVSHPKSSGDDYYIGLMKDFDDNSGYIQLKNFKYRINYDEELENQVFIPHTCIEFDIIKNYHLYIEKQMNNFDYIVFSKSLSYTPKSADFIISIIRDYIKT